ncbi:tRNA guanosine(34) transglycosylase Tgt [Candidatus Berkelbacteria bacterium]|nr:tRNA guanosine(34) transglycosylase Tgt [Candidatus Berkelbacteria bacterium]
MLTTPHGVVKTPAFLPCATHGSIRGVDQRLVADQNFELILANAYHLYLRPGIELIERLGGLHAFMGWKGAIFTDSGGFQAFALSKLVRLRRDGIEFRSHLDGSLHALTPERVILIQEQLGVDIATCLDVCTGFPAPEREVAAAVDQTNIWAERSIKTWHKKTMHLYGMVQGSIYLRERERSAKFLRTLPFSGFAIGGNMYTFGECIANLEKEKPQMWSVVMATTDILPANKPRHLLGVGEPRDLIRGVACGVDTFDCVMATRIARHATAWIRQKSDSWQYQRIDLNQSRWSQDSAPLDEYCLCLTCQSPYSRAYLHHLARENDPLLGALLSLHNLSFLKTLMQALRESILTGVDLHSILSVN